MLLYCGVQAIVRIFGIVIVVCGLVVPGTAQVVHNNYVWSAVEVSLFRHQTTFSGMLALRAEDSGSHLYQRRLELGAARLLKQRVWIGANYLFSSTRAAGRSEVVPEDRWSLYATPRIRAKGGIVISDRNMVEFRRISGVLSYRYRNRLQVEHRFGNRASALTPYAALEPVYDTRYEKWYGQPRALLGVIHPFSEHLDVNLFYMHEADSKPYPYRYNVVSAALRLHY